MVLDEFGRDEFEELKKEMNRKLVRHLNEKVDVLLENGSDGAQHGCRHWSEGILRCRDQKDDDEDE